MPVSGTLRRALQALLSSSAALIEEGADLAPYGDDFWGRRGTPGLVVRPTTTADVVATLRFASEQGISVVTRAAGTNIGVGFRPTPDSLLLDLRAFNRVLTVDAERRTAVVEPGVINGDLQARAAPLGLCFSPDPASRPLSSIGGNFAENAGGPHCLKYGVTTHHVLAVEAVCASGEVLRLGADDHGPDVLGLLAGSEGTLAVTTQLTVKLRPLAAVTRTALAVFDHAEDATEAVSAIIGAGIVPAALEFFDRSAALLYESAAPSGYPTDAEALLLIDLEGSAETVAREMDAVARLIRPTARETRHADDEKSRAALWRGRIYGAHALAAGERGYLIGDVSVPRQQIPAMYRATLEIARHHAAEIFVNGHAGDGNLHPTILLDRGNVAQEEAALAALGEMAGVAVSLGGTLTGEHGIGEEKRPFMSLRFTPAELAAQRALKAAFDPKGALNPGILLPRPADDEPTLPVFAARLTDLIARRAHGETGESSGGQTATHADADPPEPLRVEHANMTVRVGADIPLAAFHAVLAERGLCSALPHSDGSIGAALSDSAARQSFREGLLALQVTLPEGASATFGSEAIKDVAGYDMKRLFIGDDGHFGRVKALTLRVSPVATAAD